MFGLSFGEIVIIAIVALLLLGPERLPEAAKTLGKSLREIRRATDDLKDQVEREIYSEEKPAKPALVPPVQARPIPGPGEPPPLATIDNVPGLEAALAEPAPAAAEESSSPAPAPALAEEPSSPAPAPAVAEEPSPPAPATPSSTQTS